MNLRRCNFQSIMFQKTNSEPISLRKINFEKSFFVQIILKNYWKIDFWQFNFRKLFKPIFINAIFFQWILKDQNFNQLYFKNNIQNNNLSHSSHLYFVWGVFFWACGLSYSFLTFHIKPHIVVSAIDVYPSENIGVVLKHSLAAYHQVLTVS